MSETADLFVYGTLMSRARGELGADMRARLRETSTSLGAATISGRLIDLGTYPGLVEAATAEDVVHGELFRIDRADEVLPWLDSYEGISPEASPDDDYARVQVPVRRAGGEELTAWVYRYRRARAGFPVIPSGRWEG